MMQYGLVMLLYYFLYRVLKVVSLDILKGYNNYNQSTTESNAQPAKIVVVEDAQKKLSQPVFDLTDSMTIGRGAYNDIVINDSFVSHEHACISRLRDQYLLTDLNSTNGTLLNGRKVEEDIVLLSGDQIKIGAVIFKFVR
ncbi:MAG TPA: FHA domain-containing protein [Methylomusa anaerophila]|uniref:FHA domain-containing protein FhaB n=1 Tax=Methylomusa anaerophila TaxID=1930071 RepID=A0A348APN6_9FIRM|nr:FHA domain-containing protein [Methylomusa anaerophila]BBB93034.1 FHA domain-containing protein FhaB [Methylomusa anaerophila]HML87132.1 FHA domain-containing protein [Methylomusa anaerophila]